MHKYTATHTFTFTFTFVLFNYYYLALWAWPKTKRHNIFANLFGSISELLKPCLRAYAINHILLLHSCSFIHVFCVLSFTVVVLLYFLHLLSLFFALPCAAPFRWMFKYYSYSSSYVYALRVWVCTLLNCWYHKWFRKWIRAKWS